jgi:hypothetical protein
MRGIVALVPAFAAAFLFAGCKERNPVYCCTGDMCATKVSCTDPERSFCDELGNYGDKVPRTCVVDPFLPDGGGACEVPSDCHDPGTPYCVSQLCVQCEASAQCSASAPVCNAEHACDRCTVEDQCKDFGNTPHCGDNGQCVACRTDVAADCNVAGATPVCDAESAMCRGCRADDECTATGVCDDGTGACVKPQDIIFVAASAVGGAGCGTEAAPCKTLNEALAAVTPPTRIWIKVAAGTYMENLVIDGKKLNIVGPPPVQTGPVVKVIPAANLVAVAVVTGNAEVGLRNLRLSGAGGSTTNADGLRCSQGAGTELPKLSLRGVMIDGNAAQGLDVNQCDVNVVGAVVRNNTTVGVIAVDSKLSMTRSRIEQNFGGGVNLQTSDFALVNDFIVHNGNGGSTFGGVVLNGNPPSGASGARFEFNTLSANDASDGFASGLICNVSTTLAFKNDIVFKNVPDPVTTIGQVSGSNCTWSHSDIGPGTLVAGASNLNVDPTFLDATNSDYHLQATSVAKDAAEDAATVVDDFDGQKRPAGEGWDMGADEVVQ